MKFSTLLFFCVLIFFNSFSQRINSVDYKSLQKKEDSLKILSIKILEAINPIDKVKADSAFIGLLVRALKIKNSFNYSFDSVFISKLYAPDSSFKIFTWHIIVDENTIRQRGAIQMKTKDGSLKLFPLIDRSDNTKKMVDTIADNFGWMGAIYYKILLTKYLNRKYYTLLGYDENNIRSTKKVIEVLDFVDEKPIFGGYYFNVKDSSAYPQKMARFILEYKKDAAPKLNFDEGLNMIVLEHLVSETNEPEKKWTLIPDGDYEGFKWEKGKWVYIKKIFTLVTPDGQPPMPEPLRDSKGNSIKDLN